MPRDSVLDVCLNAPFTRFTAFLRVVHGWIVCELSEPAPDPKFSLFFLLCVHIEVVECQEAQIEPLYKPKSIKNAFSIYFVFQCLEETLRRMK